MTIAFPDPSQSPYTYGGRTWLWNPFVPAWEESLSTDFTQLSPAPGSQTVTIVRAANSSISMCESITDISPIIKGFDVVEGKRVFNGNELKAGDSVILGPGVYEWEGSFLNLPELGDVIEGVTVTADNLSGYTATWYANTHVYDAGYADFTWPSDILLKSTVPGAATVKFVQGRPTWYSFRLPQVAMMTQNTVPNSLAFGYENIPMFYGKNPIPGSGVVATGLRFEGLVIDINAEANIQYNREQDNLKFFRPPGVYDDSIATGVPWNLATDSRGVPYTGLWKGMDPQYVTCSRMDHTSWSDCRIIHWTGGGSMAFYGTLKSEWDSGLYAGAAPVFQSKEHFPFAPGHSSLIKRCVFEEPFDVSMGIGPMDDQAVLYTNDVPEHMHNSGMYASVCCPWYNESYEDCAVRIPESRIFQKQSGANIDYTDAGHTTAGALWPSTAWWREYATKWNMPDGTVGFRNQFVAAFPLPYGDNTLPGVTAYTGCRAENVTHVFHRDTGGCSAAVVHNCGGNCVKGVRALLPAGLIHTGLSVTNCHFEIIDYFYGNDPAYSVENGGVGGGNEAGVYLYTYPSTSSLPAARYEGVTISDNVINPKQTAWMPAVYVPYSTCAFQDGGHAIKLETVPYAMVAGSGAATHEASPGVFKNVIIKNNVVYGGLPSALVRNHVQGQYEATRIDATDWESDPRSAVHAASDAPEFPTNGLGFFHKDIGANMIWDGESEVWVQVSRAEGATALIKTIAFCGGAATNNCSDLSAAFYSPAETRGPSYLSIGYATWAIANLEHGVIGTTNPGASGTVPDFDFGYPNITANGWLNTADFHANMGGKTACQLAIESNPDAFVVLFDSTEVSTALNNGAIDTILGHVGAAGAALRATGKPVFLCTMLPMTGTGVQAKIDYYNSELPDVAAAADCHLTPVHSGLMTAGAQNTSYFNSNVPNAAGAAVIGLAVADFIRTLGGSLVQTVGPSYFVPPIEPHVVPPVITSNRWLSYNPGCTLGVRTAAPQLGLSYFWESNYFTAPTFSAVTIDNKQWQVITEGAGGVTGNKQISCSIPAATTAALMAGAGAYVRGVCRYEIVSGNVTNLEIHALAYNGTTYAWTSRASYANVILASNTMPPHAGVMVTEKFKFAADSVAGAVQLRFYGLGTIRITDFGLITDPSLII